MGWFSTSIEKQILKQVQANALMLDRIIAYDQQILKYLTQPVKMQLQFKGEQPGMPGQETDTQTIPCSALETDAAGQPVTLNPASVTWSIADPTVATLTQNVDGSATFKALKVGATTVSCTDTSVTPNLVGTDTLTVTAGPASTLVLQFGTAA